MNDLDVANLLDDLEVRDMEHGTPGGATLTTDDVRRALLGQGEGQDEGQDR
jgi:hypothetical protein